MLSTSIAPGTAELGIITETPMLRHLQRERIQIWKDAGVLQTSDPLHRTAGLERSESQRGVFVYTSQYPGIHFSRETGEDPLIQI